MNALPHVSVVLARPSEPRNIGATCRAAKNFGITDLIVVGNRTFDLDAARPLAIGAMDVFESITHIDSLGEAVAGFALVAGTTRRTGQKRKLVNYWPWELAERVAALSPASVSAPAPRAAIVFGNETSGLSDEELQECAMAVNIPASELAPSLNLSHAVEVVCYELWLAATALRTEPASPMGGERRIAALSTIQDAVESITGSLEKMEYHSQPGPQGLGQYLVDLLGRAAPSDAEVERLTKLFQSLAGRSGRAS